MVAVVVTNYLQFLVLGVGMLTISDARALADAVDPPYKRNHFGLPRRRRHIGRTKMERRNPPKIESPSPPRATGPRWPMPSGTTCDDGKARLCGTTPRNWPRATSLSNTAAARRRRCTMGNPVNPAAQHGVGLAWLLWQVLFTFTAAVTWQTGVSLRPAPRTSPPANESTDSTRSIPSVPFLAGAVGDRRVLVLLQGRRVAPGHRRPHRHARILGPAAAHGNHRRGDRRHVGRGNVTDSSYILTWATVIYNDLIMPCFRRPLTEKAKLSIIRTLIVMIGVFLVFYGLVYELPGTAFDYLAVTGTICVASMFALLMGSVYMPWTNWVGASAAIVLARPVR